MSISRVRRIASVSIVVWIFSSQLSFALESALFCNDPKLEAAAVSHPAHILLGHVGDHVGKIQQALTELDGAVIDSVESQSKRYGPSTAQAVLAYKKRYNILGPGQTVPDNIVGIMTTKHLDQQMAAQRRCGSSDGPSTGPESPHEPPGIAPRQCVNTPNPTCGVYDNCFSSLCDCESSPYEYFRTYGKKYCLVFLNSSKLSPAGQAWRDRTLKCLQETIVPLLPPYGQARQCDCQKMRTEAFKSHVTCYTGEESSICDLPKEDLVEITKSVEVDKALLDEASRTQMMEVAKICINKQVAKAKEHLASEAKERAAQFQRLLQSLRHVPVP